MTRTGKLFFVMIFLAAIVARPVAAQTGIKILSPVQGDVLQGVVTILGTSELDGFQSSELDFSYSDDTTGTWFLITTNAQPVNEDVIATWDTTTITDGTYSLRLRVFLTDGSFQDANVLDLRVRNYTAIETPTPALTAVQPTSTPTATEMPTPFPTPTSQPPNPVIVTQTEISNSIVWGGLGAVFLLILLGIYLAIRRK